MTVAAVIVAAGKGIRFGSIIPKQYQMLAGKPVIARTIERFLDHDGIDCVQMVIDLNERGRLDGFWRHRKMLEPVAGGASRQQSVHNGLEALRRRAPDKVLIHDGARPFLSANLIDRLIRSLERYQAVLPTLKITDTLKTIEGDRVRGDQNRDLLVRAQTPQAFHFDLIRDAHASATDRFTDDAGILVQQGHAVHLIEGEESNHKITQADDIRKAELEFLRPRRWRSAQGYDVHRLVKDRMLYLCGVEIPHERGLDGHSDADVVLHALTDAILGLTASDDIGTHFPPSDPSWKNASSGQFLEHSMALLSKARGELDHIDLTIICETPKIGPHRDRMRASLQRLTGLPGQSISIKATTNERLGFLGRGEGIAALAQATASLPLDQA